ncbi:MAG: hypothetical protein H6625_09970 [Bdellovibrionaceae bacterium]|nr:hypothetical protein [Pseudobdellovibrionaceae bacterium]
MLRKYKSLYVLSLLLLCIIWTPSTYGQSTQGANFANDQKVHAGISAAISAGLYISLKNSGYSRWSSFLGSFFLTLSVGAIKEITDDHVTEKDLVADTAGAFAGSLLFVSLDF